jgi:U3 small nucleolar RNA-associated protein 10
MLTLLAEVLAMTTLPGSFELISQMLETLSRVIQRVPLTEVSSTCVEQLLMSAVDNSASKIVASIHGISWQASADPSAGRPQCHSKPNTTGNISRSHQRCGKRLILVLAKTFSFNISVADNPQTFHQALLLMATLAKLAPDSVLHNVMPVFTFMGANVFQRDDSYSFRVVQKV